MSLFFSPLKNKNRNPISSLSLSCCPFPSGKLEDGGGPYDPSVNFPSLARLDKHPLQSPAPNCAHMGCALYRWSLANVHAKFASPCHRARSLPQLVCTQELRSLLNIDLNSPTSALSCRKIFFIIQGVPNPKDLEIFQIQKI